MAITIPSGALGSSTFPHRKYHGMLPEVRYAHSDGNNANDGLTWGTAKQTILAAYDALPTVGGTVYIGGTEVAVGGEVANQGLWFLGGGDSAAANPPAGWRTKKTLTRFIGAGGTVLESFNLQPQISVAAGSNTDRSKPALWVNGTAGTLVLENLNFHFPAVGFKLGIDSTTGSRSTGNTAGLLFKNVNLGLNNIILNGPPIDMGNIYWSYFDNFTTGANRATYTLTAASIVSGTIARFTTSITHALEVGDTVDIRNVTPSAYNNSASIPPWTITAVTSTTFDADIGSSPAAASAFGTALPVEHARAAAIYAPELATFVMRDSMLSGGGVLLGGNGGPSPSNVELNNCLKEGSGGTRWDMPFYQVRDPLGSGANHAIIQCSVADQNSIADVYTPDGMDPSRVVVSGSFLDIKGPMTIQGGNFKMTDGFPSRHRAVGLWDDRFYGQVDAARRNFHPTATRFTNLANQDTTAWSGLTGDADVTTGVSAPDGTTGAATLSTALSGIRFRRLYSASITIAVGDWLVVGAWLRRASLAVLDEGISWMSWGSIHGDNVMSLGPNAVSITHPLGTIAGEGEWVWVSQADKFVTVGTPLTTIRADIFCTQDSDRSYYAPVAVRIPTGTLSNTEVLEYAQNMGTWPDTAPVGAISTLRSQKLIAYSGLGVGNSAAATTPGSVVKKMEVFSETGASLGFVPIYSSIT